MTSLSKKQTNLDLILLPRGYISPSALDLWEKSPKKYGEKYFEGKDDDFSNTFCTYGKKVAEYKETGKWSDDPTVVFGANFLPSFGNNEHEQRTTLKTPYGNIVLLGKFDDFSPELIEVLEHKTGKTVWTQNRVVKLLQLRFYAVICDNEFDRIPLQKLTWVETTDTDKDGRRLEKVRPTGRCEQFLYKATREEIEETKKRIINACLQIDKAYKNYLKQIENA